MNNFINIISDIFEQKKHLLKRYSKLYLELLDTAFNIFLIFWINLSPGKDELFLPISHIEKKSSKCFCNVPSEFKKLGYHGNESFKNKFKIIILTGEPFYLNLLSYIFNKFKFKKIFN